MGSIQVRRPEPSRSSGESLPKPISGVGGNLVLIGGGRFRGLKTPVTNCSTEPKCSTKVSNHYVLSPVDTKKNVGRAENRPGGDLRGGRMGKIGPGREKGEDTETAKRKRIKENVPRGWNHERGTKGQNFRRRKLSRGLSVQRVRGQGNDRQWGHCRRKKSREGFVTLNRGQEKKTSTVLDTLTHRARPEPLPKALATGAPTEGGLGEAGEIGAFAIKKGFRRVTRKKRGRSNKPKTGPPKLEIHGVKKPTGLVCDGTHFPFWQKETSAGRKGGKIAPGKGDPGCDTTLGGHPTALKPAEKKKQVGSRGGHNTSQPKAQGRKKSISGQQTVFTKRSQRQKQREWGHAGQSCQHVEKKKEGDADKGKW